MTTSRGHRWLSAQGITGGLVMIIAEVLIVASLVSAALLVAAIVLAIF